MVKKDPTDLFAGLAQQRQRKEQRADPPTVESTELPVTPVTPPTEVRFTEPERSTQKQGRAKGKRSNSDYTQVGAYIPKDLKKQVDRLLFDEDDTDFSDLVATLLQKWVSSKSTK